MSITSRISTDRDEDGGCGCVLDWYLPWKRGDSAMPTAEAGRLSCDLGRPDRPARERPRRTCCCAISIRRTSSGAPNESGVQRVGLIDFQDAMIGPTAYDLASIAQDARVTIEPRSVEQLMERLSVAAPRAGRLRRSRLPEELGDHVGAAHCKLVGLWVRLMQRDGKPGYHRSTCRARSPISTWRLSTKRSPPARLVRTGWNRHQPNHKGSG